MMRDRSATGDRHAPRKSVDAIDSNLPVLSVGRRDQQRQEGGVAVLALQLLWRNLEPEASARQSRL